MKKRTLHFFALLYRSRYGARKRIVKRKECPKGDQREGLLDNNAAFCDSLFFVFETLDRLLKAKSTRGSTQETLSRVISAQLFTDN